MSQRGGKQTPEWEQRPLKGRNGSVEVCNHVPQRSHGAGWGTRGLLCGVRPWGGRVSIALATDGALGKGLDANISQTPFSLPLSLPPSFLLPLSLSLLPCLRLLSYHLLYPGHVRGALFVI